MSIKTLYADLDVHGTISENGVALEDKYMSKDEEEILTQEVICSHFGEITGNTNDEHGLAINDQQMIISKIEGQTLIANNLVSFENATTQTINGITFTVNKEAGTVLANGTATDTATFFFGCILNAYKNHKYLISAGRLFDGDANQSYFGSGGWQVFRDFGSGGIISSREENTPYQDIAIVLKAGFVANNLLFVPQIIDLTLMFGYGNEPTLDEWKAMNMPLIPYSTGYVLNSKANLLSTTKNVCPRGQWILGERYDSYTGEVRTAGLSTIRFDAKIYVTNNIKYYLWTSKAFSSWQMFCYDSNDKYLGTWDVGSTSWTTPLLGTSYVRIAIWTDSSIDDGRIPAEYNVTPFERIAESLPYQSSELVIDQELGKWEYIDNNSNTKYSRVKSIDLGTLNWAYFDGYKGFYSNDIANVLPNEIRPVDGISVSHYLYMEKYTQVPDDVFSTSSNSDCDFQFAINMYGLFKIRNLAYTDPTQLKAALSGVMLYYKSNEETITTFETPIPDGMAVWNGGQQSQVGQLPYILNKQYSLSLSAQVAANIQIDKEQQTQINNLYDEVSSMESYIDNKYEKMTNYYIGHPEGGDAWLNTSADTEVGAVCIRIPYIPYGGHIKFKTSIADARYQSSADYVISFTFSTHGHIGNAGAYCMTALENQIIDSTQLYNLNVRFSSLEEGYFYVYLGEIDKQWNCPTVSISDVTFFTWAAADANILRKNWAITLETTINHSIEHSTSKTGLYTPKRTDYTLDEIGMPNSSITAPFTVQPFMGSTRAMRLFGLPANQIIVEQSIDGGVTWNSANIDDWSKKQMFTQSRLSSFKIPLKNGNKSCDCMLRVTITGMKYNIPDETAETEKYNYWNSNYVTETERYCSLDFGYFWISSNTDKIYIEHQIATGANSTNWIEDGSLQLATGWTGGNYVKFSGKVLGGSSTQLYNYWNHRFIFRTQAADGSFDDSKLNQDYLTTQQAIYEISCYGQNYWTAANKMMQSDRPYTVDSNMTCEFDGGVSTPKGIWATGNISSGSYIDTTSYISAKGGFIFSGQADQDKKLLRADGWWQSVNDFASATHTHETIENDLTINGTATATELILTPNAFINTATISVIADAPDMTTIDISTNTQISGQLTADSANITNTLAASTILVGDVPVITSDDLRFKLLVPNQNTQSYAISTTLLLPLHEIIILISNNSSSATANITILQNDSTEIFSNTIAGGKVMRISGYRIGDSGLLFYGENEVSSLTSCASGIYKVNSTVPVTLTIIGR